MSMYCYRCAFFNSPHLVHKIRSNELSFIFLSTFSEIEFLETFFEKGTLVLKAAAFYNQTFSYFSFWKITPPPFCT